MLESLPTSFGAPGQTYSPSPAEILSSSSLAQNSMSYTSEDETEYSTDEMRDSLCSSDKPSAAQTTTPWNVLKHVLSPMKQELVDRVMKAFWKAFYDEIKFSWSAWNLSHIILTLLTLSDRLMTEDPEPASSSCRECRCWRRSHDN
jgi:hypothetical protein